MHVYEMTQVKLDVQNKVLFVLQELNWLLAEHNFIRSSHNSKRFMQTVPFIFCCHRILRLIQFWPISPSPRLWWKPIGLARQGCPQSWGFALVCPVISQSSHGTHTERPVMISVHIPLQRAQTFSWTRRELNFSPWAADAGLLFLSGAADK